MRKNKNKGFSMVELIVVIAVMVVLLAVLAPSLLKYVENSRVQKDESAMDEVCNAAQLALADSNTFDEVFSYAIPNNYITYSDSSGKYGAKYTDEEFWAPDGIGTAVTITFNPDDNGTYNLADGLVNDMTKGNGSTGETRTSETVKQCRLEEMGDGKFYAALKKTVGTTFSEKSSTYKNSSYTVFIKFDLINGIYRPEIYGSFNGTNLSEGCLAAVGSGTSEYTPEGEAVVTKPTGGTQTPNFTSSDLQGGGSVVGGGDNNTPAVTNGQLQYNKPYVGTMPMDSLNVVASLEFYEGGTYTLFYEGCPVEDGTFTQEDKNIYLDGDTETPGILSNDGTQITADGITLTVEDGALPHFGKPYVCTIDGITAEATLYEDGSISFTINGETETAPAGSITYENGRVYLSDDPSISGRVSSDKTTISAVWASDGETLPMFIYDENYIPPVLYSFTINSNVYKFTENMTWEQWCASGYNTSGYYINEDKIQTTDNKVIDGAKPFDLIIENANYTASQVLIGWEELIAASEDGTYKTKYPIGSLITLSMKNGTTTEFRVVGHDYDELENGRGKAHISLVSEQAFIVGRMNTTNTNVGGWRDSYMRAQLNSTYLDKYIPDEVENNIKTVSKKSYEHLSYSDGVHTGGSQTTADKLWIPSYTEVGFTNYTAITEAEGGAAYAYFTSDASRDITEGNTWWWLRSADNYCDTHFRGVLNGTGTACFTAGSSAYVLLGFCI